ncbi:hypothetical protein SPHINGO8AM_70110 [Sphingomonas sp. 8AM]|nr:hypothetical protein SPHINGO8AM_70110 [Sphingomonas sp. 8AM]
MISLNYEAAVALSADIHDGQFQR